MIYVLTKSKDFKEHEGVTKLITEKEASRLFDDCKNIQFYANTTGINPKTDAYTMIAISNIKKEKYLIIDCKYVMRKDCFLKKILEEKTVVMHFGLLHLQFLAELDIYPTSVYDTLEVEKLIYNDVPYVDNYEVFIPFVAILKERFNIEFNGNGKKPEFLSTKYCLGMMRILSYLRDVYRVQMKDCKEKGYVDQAKARCKYLLGTSKLEHAGLRLSTPLEDLK